MVLLSTINLGCGNSKSENVKPSTTKPSYDYYCAGCRKGFNGSGYTNTPKGTWCSMNCFVQNN